MSSVTITPVTQPLTGSVQLPGSKSITNRALLVAALAEGTSTIRGALKSDDTRYMAAALSQLGIRVEEPDSTTFIVHGRGGHFLEPKEPLFLGNAGTATRFLTAAATLVVGEVVITGVERMQMRPIKDLTDALAQLSVKIETNEGCPPVRITSTGKLTGFSVKIRGDISSQYLSALLMTLPYAADKEIQIELTSELTSHGYVDITTAVMSAFGVTPLTGSSGKFSKFVVPKKKYKACDFLVEPDASSATYIWGASALTGGDLRIGNGGGSWSQPDAVTQPIFEQFPRPFGVVDATTFPDAVPTLAVVAAFADGTSHFKGLKTLRVKECDRIVAVVTELNKIKPGIAREVGDEIIIEGDRDLATSGQSAEIFTYDDHRIAMAFSLAALRVPGITILNAECVNKTFPGYWDMLAGIGVGITRGE